MPALLNILLAVTLWVQVPQWNDDWSNCAVDVPDTSCHWYIVQADNTFGEGFDWETAPWYSVEGLQDVANLHDQTLESGHLFIQWKHFKMKEFDYDLDYKKLDFTDPETRKLYRIGRGEQGVLLVRPYTDDICAHWRFVDETAARKSSAKIYEMFLI